MFAKLKLILIACLVYLGLASPQESKAHSRRAMRTANADAGFVDLNHALLLGLGIVGIIIGVVVGLQILAALFPTYTGSVANISTNMTSANWGNTTANSIGPVFGLVISLVGMFAVVGIVLLAFSLYNTRKGKGKGPL